MADVQRMGINIGRCGVEETSLKWNRNVGPRWMKQSNS